MLTGPKLARVIYEELHREGWGDIDPYWFKQAGVDEYGPDDREASPDAVALGELLDRVAKRINDDTEV